MREIKFRGKRIDNGEWVYGFLVESQTQKYIVGNMVESNEEYCNLEYWWPVIPETVGQFTGLKDKNGREIYEGDILRWEDMFNFEVRWLDSQARFYSVNTSAVSTQWTEYCTIIGNIYENPELLK